MTELNRVEYDVLTGETTEVPVALYKGADEGIVVLDVGSVVPGGLEPLEEIQPE